MGLRIRTNMAAAQAQRQLAQTTERSQNVMQKLSSGYRINKAADDAAGLAISETMRAQTVSGIQAKRNAADGISLVQIAEGGLSEMSTILIRLRELAVQSASDTIGNPERAFANREYVSLVDEIERISKVTEFNGLKLLGGREVNDLQNDLEVQVGIGPNVLPNADTIAIDLEKIRVNPTELGLSNGAEIGPANDEPFSRETAAAKLRVIDTACKRSQAHEPNSAQRKRDSNLPSRT